MKVVKIFQEQSGRLQIESNCSTNNELLELLSSCITSLKNISHQLGFVEFKMKTARDCYATTLRRNAIPLETISELLGHSNTMVTRHYIGSMDLETITKANECLI